VQVGEEDVQLDDVLQLATSGFGHQGQIVEHAAYLGFKALDHFHGLGIQRDLAGQVHSVTHLDGLRVGTDCGRGVFTGDDLLVHEGLHWVQFFKRVIRTTPCRARIRLISCERCSRPRTRSASCTTLILPSRSPTLILSMLASATVILVASWAMMPRGWSISALSSIVHSPLTFLSQVRCRICTLLPRCSARLLQVYWWMTMALARVMKPTMGSPGIGLRQRAKLTTFPSVPRSASGAPSLLG